MPGQQPDIIRLYRIIHIDNVRYVLTHGMHRRGHPNADPAYVNIGDRELIEQRQEYEVGVDPPGGLLGDYVPFYFGTLSPMLLNIKSGKKGVYKRHQQEIVYIVCRLENVVNHCNEWCFTNGHAKAAITTFYNRLDDLTEVYWDTVGLRYWTNTEEEFDKMRRKQAEFLVRDHVPAQCIAGIITYNKTAADTVKEILGELGLNIPVRINPNNDYYYY